MRFSFLIPAALAASVFAGQAIAADLVVADAPVAVPAAGFDWEGGYAGIYGGGRWILDTDGEYGVVGVRAGYNFLLSESVLAGIEADGEVLDGTNGTFTHLSIGGRLGLLASDSVLIYAKAGVGTEFNEDGDSTNYYGVGLGAEFAVTDSISIVADVDGGSYFDYPGDFIESVGASVGINFHF